jgi:hypothetical protein
MTGPAEAAAAPSAQKQAAQARGPIPDRPAGRRRSRGKHVGERKIFILFRPYLYKNDRTFDVKSNICRGIKRSYDNRQRLLRYALPGTNILTCFIT